MRHYPMPKDALPATGEDLTEQEHKDSCDINKMVRNAARGVLVRGSKKPQIYGEDDTTMSGLDYRIQRAKLEEDLANTAQEHEFTEAELALMPKKVAEKFRFKKKKDQKPGDNANDKTNAKKPDPGPEKEAGKATDPKSTAE